MLYISPRFKEKLLVNMLKKKLKNGLVVSKGGRNNLGRITSRRKGGGHKRIYRLVDFKKLLWNISGFIIKFEYDPNRTALLSLICYTNGVLSYNIAVENSKIGDQIFVGINNGPFTLGSTYLMSNLLDGMLINNIELYSKNGSALVRSAGTVAQLIKSNWNNSNFSLIRLPSKEERLIFSTNIATVGQVSNLDHFLIRLKNAGKSRHLGIRPVSRGVAQNPIDHPHGGGQGKTKGAGGQRSQVTFTGKVAKGKPTRLKNKKNNFIIFSRKGKFLNL